jgi:imidazolonepropionase-like amidohydrolase
MADAILIRARRLFVADGGDPIVDGAVLIQDGTIVGVGAAADLEVADAPDRRVVDYGDATIVPGLIDVHTHPSNPDGGSGVAVEETIVDDSILVLQAAQNAGTILRSGVTTARDMGAKGLVGIALRTGIEQGLVVGPRMVVCGRPVTMTGGHMWFYGAEADGDTEVRKAVRQLFKEGADYVKIAATGGGSKTSNRFRPSYTVQELTAIVDEAHRVGKLTAAHASSTGGVINSLDAGVDLIAHGYFYEADGSYRYRPDVADRLAASAFVNPTLFLRRAEMNAAEARREGAGVLTPREEARLAYSTKSLEQRLEGVGRMHAAGVRIVAGSDSPFGRYPAGQFVHEIKMLGEAGLSNRDAIRAATSVAADAIGLGSTVGSLRPGMTADVLVVQGDPTVDLDALWDVLDVYHDGRLVERGGPPIPPSVRASSSPALASAANR